MCLMLLLDNIFPQTQTINVVMTISSTSSSLSFNPSLHFHFTLCNVSHQQASRRTGCKSFCLLQIQTTGKTEKVRCSSWKIKCIYCKLPFPPNLHHSKDTGWTLLSSNCSPLCWHQISRSMYFKYIFVSAGVLLSWDVLFFRKQAIELCFSRLLF